MSDMTGAKTSSLSTLRSGQTEGCFQAPPGRSAHFRSEIVCRLDELRPGLARILDAELVPLLF